MASLLQLFSPASQDKSLEYLYRLFGDMNGLLGVPSTSISLFGELFRKFNTIALTIGTLIVVYATIVGVLKTAAEGEFLGKQWNSLWVPLRMVLGIAALFPTPSGYSGLQILMMWVIMQGIGAADTVWRTAIATISQMKSPYTKTLNVPPLGINDKMATIFTMVTCNRTLNQPESKIIQGSYYVPPKFGGYKTCKDNDCSIGYAPKNAFERNTSVWQGTSQGIREIQIGDCGTIQLGEGGACLGGDSGNFDGKSPQEITSMLSCRVANNQLTAIQATRELFAPIADALVDIDYQYLQFVELTNQFNALWIGEQIRQMVPPPRPPQPKAFTEKLDQLKKFYDNHPFIQKGCDKLIEKGIVQRQTKGQSNRDSCIFFTTFATQSAIYNKLGFPPSVPTAEGGVAISQKTSIAQVYYPALIARLPKLEKEDFITTAVENYIAAISKPVVEYKQWQIAKAAAGQTEIPAGLRDAEKNGWMFAGAYYYLLSKDNNKSFDAVAGATLNTQLSAAVTNPIGSNYYLNTNTALWLTEVTKNSGQGFAGQTGGAMIFSGEGTEAAAKGMDKSKEAFNVMSAGWRSNVKNSTTDPLITLQAWGWSLLFVVPILWVGLVVIFALVSFFAGLEPTVLGTGMGAPGREPFRITFLFLVPVFFGLFSALIGIGGLIGIYTPFVPYVIFITGALGWMISIVETMVAGPLVALGILAPGGHHDVLGKAEPALMLLFGNFIRPTLMIFGLFAAMLLAPIAMDLLNSTFDMAMISVSAMGTAGMDDNYNITSQGGMANPVAFLFFICVYVMLTIALLNKCFAAIHIIPERVMAWLGSQGQQYGESEALGEGKKGVEGGAHGVTGSMDQSKGAARDTASTKSGHKNAQEREDRQESKASAREASRNNPPQGGGTQ